MQIGECRWELARESPKAVVRAGFTQHPECRFHRPEATPEGFWSLTHWGLVTHICVSKLTTIGSDNGLSPGRRQAIILTNAGILLTGPLAWQRSNIYKRDLCVTSLRFHNRAWELQRQESLSETSGILLTHRGTLSNQGSSLATGYGIKALLAICG